MKDIVEKILKEEETASKLVEKSRLEAENIIFKAKKEAMDLINDITLKAKEEAQKKKIDTDRECISKKAKVLQEIKMDLSSLREKRERNIPELARKIFYQIIKINI